LEKEPSRISNVQMLQSVTKVPTVPARTLIR
jgi:hypothetical protein